MTLSLLCKSNTKALYKLFLHAAHTPDNSFMGFVAEELNHTERLNIQRDKVNNMAVIYGKEASMWKVSTHTHTKLFL